MKPEEMIPPRMARASDAYCSLPGSSASAIGINPSTVARVVIRIGRNRIEQASEIALRMGMPLARSVPTNSTIRMLFDTAMPAIMITPISDITFSVVPGRKQEQHNPAETRRNRQQDDERIGERSKLRHQDQIYQHDRRARSLWPKLLNDSCMS